MSRFLRFIQIGLILFLAGCSSLAPLLTTPTPVPVLEATSTPQVTPTQTMPVLDQPSLLRVWLPPQFDPNAGTPSAELLKQRLLDFETDHPGVKLEIRIKAENGNTDLLDILSATSNAAPAVMPDLIALSYSDVQTAASTGFLHPLEGMTNILQDPDWYAVAREFGQYQNTEVGLPFASDAQLIVYRPAAFEPAPSSWNRITESGSYLVFPVSDPNAIFSINQYLSDGGQLTDEQGVITLNEETLTRVLSFHKIALETGTVPFEIGDFRTDEQSLQFFREGKADLAVAWASSDIKTQSGQYMPVLGLNDVSYSLANGWVWALAGTNVENQPLAVELATYLVESGFMSEWTRASGYLPTRPQALEGWDDDQLKVSINEVLQSAHPVPVDSVLSVVGPLMQEALVRIFNGEQPEVVARSVIESIK